MTSAKTSYPSRVPRAHRRGAILTSLFLLAALAGGCRPHDAPPPQVRWPQRAVKIHAEERGIYRVTGQALADAGIDLESVDPRHLALVHVDHSVPILLDGVERTIEPDDAIVFFAEGGTQVRIPYVNITRQYFPRTQVFMLYLDRSKFEPRRYERHELDTPAERDPRTYPVATVRGDRHFEDNPTWDFFPVYQDPDDPVDFVFWKKFSSPATSESPASARIDFALPDIVESEPGELTIKLAGRTQIGARDHNVRHRFLINVNGRHAEELSWNNAIEVPTLTIPAGVLRRSGNQIELTLLEPGAPAGQQAAPVAADAATTGNTALAAMLAESGGAPNLKIDIVYLDWFNVRFAQRSILTGGANEFVIGEIARLHEEAAATTTTAPAAVASAEAPVRRLSIQDIDGEELLLLDPDRALAYTGETYAQGVGSPYQALNVEIPDRPTRLAGATRAGQRTPTEISAVTIKGIFDRPREAEFLILAPAAFAETLAPLVEWKRSRGLSTELVVTEDIYNERMGGYASVRPLRDFIHAPRDGATTSSLRYVLLAGDSSSIYKEVSFIPAYSYLESGRHATDNYFANYTAWQDPPVVAVGRIPARTVEELNTVVGKIIDYEKGDNFGPWRASYLLIAASHQWARDHAQSIMRDFVVPNYAVNYIQTDISERKPGYHDQLNRELTEGFNAGNLITAFFGHGGGAVWEVGPTQVTAGFQRHLFNQEHVRALKNIGRPSLIFALTCYTNDFDAPFQPETLGETFANAAGGAIAIIGANDRSYTSLNITYLTQFLQLVQERREGMRLGDYFAESKRLVKNRAANEQYQFLGDPSLEFTLPREDVLIEEAAWDNAPRIARYSVRIPDSVPLPATVESYLLDSRNRIVVHWREERAERAWSVERHVPEVEPFERSLRVVCYVNEGGGVDHVGGANILRPEPTTVASPASAGTPTP